MKMWMVRYCSCNWGKINCFEKPKCIVDSLWWWLWSLGSADLAARDFFILWRVNMRFVTEQRQIVAASPSVPPHPISIIPPMLHIDSFIYHQRNTRTILATDIVVKQQTLKTRRTSTDGLWMLLYHGTWIGGFIVAEITLDSYIKR
jgi:hypothetical protein